ncbi:MAG: tetratricopeptide repeat protein, partial [Deltaproteobacteria bacterium]|nr:tetratricopeptide repeat protein [Deltaproteobacteria bacterium]
MPYRPRYVLRGLGVAILLAMPVACGRCIENVVPPQCLEHETFCGQYLGQNNLTSAEARCKLALEFCPTRGEPYNLLGMIEHSRGRDDKALDYFKQALSYKEDFPEALNNMGAIYMERREYDVACDLFRQALDIDPGYQTARRNYATCLMYRGEAGLARDEYLKCVEVDPNDCDCRLGL